MYGVSACSGAGRHDWIGCGPPVCCPVGEASALCSFVIPSQLEALFLSVPLVPLSRHQKHEKQSGGGAPSHQGILNVDDDVEEEFEVDINDTEPEFLKGQSAKSGVEVSPVKIVANPDGSLQRAAMTQSALAKERRELREQQQRTLLEAIPKDLSRPWEDPLPEAGERHLAQARAPRLFRPPTS